MGSILTRVTEEQRRAAACALEDLLAVLALAGADLPDAEIDWHYGRLTGSYLIDLGCAPPDRIGRIADLLRKGLRFEQQA
ncbi:hypothetical protein RMN57_07170 [Kitasatospora sp. CM 4170]|uniref:Uncharacterized protein n=1 Tax=Kitasatospora aburaviensis TaxID=67265 RepID=A0ABW1ERB3_9ACTN|nr:hypothetical protein [Kitasatospora sp. CM 4170]WNM44504.1 hypothetical protein RMN57_07170 [Kitasatospora sp. CM 4170]